MSTFGPAYSDIIDRSRVSRQMDRVKAYMLNGQWNTLGQIADFTGDPESSVSAQLRHLRKAKFGGYLIEKRRRMSSGGTWEYRMHRGLDSADEKA